MNAAVVTIGNRTLSREGELLNRARGGDESALIEIFDAVIYDVYSYAYLETGKVTEAERIADATGGELAWIVRGHDVFTLAEVRDRLLDSAARKVETYRAGLIRNKALGDIRANLRHMFLGGSAMLSLVYAGVMMAH
jgi:hypothetical protein